MPDPLRWAEAQAAKARTVGRVLAEFRALGPLEAVVAGRLVDLGAPKQRALLALLVSRAGQPVAVEVILEALWAEHPPPSAMASLQAYVANLRRVLEPDRAPRAPATVLRTCPPGYLLDRRVIDVDVHRFSDHATTGWQAWDRGDAQQALNEFDVALALWRGQAYAEVANATCVVPEVARLEELRLSVVEARCAALLAVGAHEVAVAELDAFVHAYPLREYGCELLSLALYRAGRQADALGVLRAIQRRLAEELGIDPRPALQHLEREILNQVPALEWRPAPPVPPQAVPDRPVAVGRGWTTGPPPPAAPSPAADGEVFVGREEALRQLLEAMTGTTVRGRVVTVSGEPGVGKTSLLRRFATLAGAPVLWGSCPEHVTAPPLWLWEQILRAAGTCFPQHPVPGPVAELLNGDHQQMVAGIEVASANLRRFEAIVHYLTDASQAAPLVVVLDHLHRADPSSLRLLAHLAESVPENRLLLAVSYRSGETATLAETLAALARSEMTRIELAGLNTQETQSLASALLRREVSRPTAEGLWDRTEGNPFFLREVIKLLTTEQRLAQPHTVPVPVPVREVVLRRIGCLAQSAVDVLSVAAVAGRHFDIEIVAEAASVEIEAALEIMDTVGAAGLVVEDQQRLGWFRFTHALTAETLYETTGRLRRVRLHRRIGVAAARAWAGLPDRAAEIARHWFLAAELDPAAAAHAATHAATAARAADARLAFAEAATLWRQALTATDLSQREDTDRYPLLCGLGASLYRAGNPHDGLPVFIQAIEESLVAGEAHDAPDASRPVAAAVAAISEPLWRQAGDGEVGRRLVDVLERALAQVTDPGQRALLLSCLGAARLPGDDHRDRRRQAGTELLALPGLPPPMTVRARQLRAQAGAAPDAAGEGLPVALVAGEVAAKPAPTR
ncbi:BTAD domain-containing putative transcriptional regulator [Micromonospora matsumotoense]|uniref:BTAD domain-containing putative transcriptional regulator n=1 Tax=Micromonospora matsumotoense TaxID=121616 RepID=UPI0033E4AFF6